ncbi:MAG: alpha/beta fold hydrolase [Thermogemmata sp.]|uniref:Alpha/beta fold hydrolase n=1 Tax=Thermogemmata fonticola TaxID=2755323 RepID=A0A7V8VEQ5_9BACT|nr:alpha/beta fold hydrolase [Thermogemmata fonticola]MBA2226622.1 alpha/beta fold hydrolase [Thermogemmata fonticola]MCX8140046.1 alpha/beta fold hydrolase [Gemmataceae bacterium]
MATGLLTITALLFGLGADVPVELWQVAPDMKGKSAREELRKTKERAVVLIPGLKLHPVRPALAACPEMHKWQQPRGELVRALAEDFDVFALGYAQTAPVDVVARAPALRAAVELLEKADYREIVLIGHSAGGVLARLFVATYPQTRVSKVITTASPHAGALLARLPFGYPKIQAPFVQSLTPEARRALAQPVDADPNKPMEMVCVVARLPKLLSDGLVDVDSQWPAECRAAGVPAVVVEINHFEVLMHPASVQVVARLAREKLRRWTPEEVDQAVRLLLLKPGRHRRP